jgi:hypothetical protein
MTPAAPRAALQSDHEPEVAISAELERGKPFHRKSIRAMLDR